MKRKERRDYIQSNLFCKLCETVLNIPRRKHGIKLRDNQGKKGNNLEKRKRPSRPAIECGVTAKPGFRLESSW
jgi:predicted amidophosphoribosyltransferase